MKKTFGILLVIFSLSAMADDVIYQCSFNARVETIKTNIFGGNPKTINVTEFNPCSTPTIASFVTESGTVSVSECGVFTNDINFGLNLRAQRTVNKQARFELIHLDRKMNHQNDYTKKSVLQERYVELGKEVLLEVSTNIDFYQKSRRVKEVITQVSVLCLKAN